MNANEYRKLASAARAAEIIHDVPVPSGGVWQMTEPPIRQFILSGKLPSALAVKMTAHAQKRSNNEAEALKAAVEDLTPEDLLNNLIFGRELLIYCARSPRIVMDRAPEGDNEISPEEILPEDFTFLISWCLRGGKTGESLATFRGERSEPAVDSPLIS